MFNDQGNTAPQCLHIPTSLSVFNLFSVYSFIDVFHEIIIIIIIIIVIIIIVVIIIIII